MNSLHDLAPVFRRIFAFTKKARSALTNAKNAIFRISKKRRFLFFCKRSILPCLKNIMCIFAIFFNVFVSLEKMITSAVTINFSFLDLLLFYPLSLRLRYKYCKDPMEISRLLEATPHLAQWRIQLFCHKRLRIDDLIHHLGLTLPFLLLPYSLPLLSLRFYQ